MHLAGSANLPGAQAILLTFFPRPKTEVENDIYAQCEGAARNIPKHLFNQRVARIVFRIIGILTEERNVPLINRQAQGGKFNFEALCKCRLA